MEQSSLGSQSRECVKTLILTVVVYNNDDGVRFQQHTSGKDVGGKERMAQKFPDRHFI